MGFSSLVGFSEFFDKTTLNLRVKRSVILSCLLKLFAMAIKKLFSQISVIFANGSFCFYLSLYCAFFALVTNSDALHFIACIVRLSTLSNFCSQSWVLVDQLMEASAW